MATKESIDINKSLLTLRQVITTLTERKADEMGYVPYRDSKLTQILRQSLGGNSFTLMLACLNPCDAQIDENFSTLNYASKASYISNKPMRNEDPKLQQIKDLKNQVRILTEELANANETIAFLSSLTGKNPALVKQNINRIRQGGGGVENTPENFHGHMAAGEDSAAILHRQDSAVSNNGPDEISSVQRDNINRINANRQGTAGTVMTQSAVSNNAANETKDAITGRIIHTVNMMKEVLQGNLGLRDTIQKQSELIDNQNQEIFQL